MKFKESLHVKLLTNINFNLIQHNLILLIVHSYQVPIYLFLAIELSVLPNYRIIGLVIFHEIIQLLGLIWLDQ